jgi:TonB family protein
MRAIQIVAVVLMAARTGIAVAAEDPLGAAKDLYASAAYEEALSALSRVDIESSSPDIARQTNEYRAFCLYALGRTHEAESIAEAMIRREPLLQLNPADASPRIESMFVEVRKRLLPSLIRERFRTARSALEQKSLGVAEPPLTEARLMIVEAGKLGIADEGLGDLSDLVDGFLQLIRSTREQRAASASPAPSVAAADPRAAQRAGAAESASGPIAPSAGGRSRPGPTASSAAASVPPRPTAPTNVAGGGNARAYSIEDQEVAPPIAVDQSMPALPAETTQMARSLHATGILEVVIDETGQVVDATMRQSVSLGFDNAILRVARRWKYRPATKNGVPVRFVKLLALVP